MLRVTALGSTGWPGLSFSRLRSLWHDAGGSIAVEFALLLPVQVLFGLGMLDLASATLIEQRLTFATEAAARCAATKNGMCSSASAAASWAAQQSGGVPNISAGNFTVDFGSPCGGVSVIASYNYSGTVLPNIRLGAEACYVPEQTAPGGPGQ